MDWLSLQQQHADLVASDYFDFVPGASWHDGLTYPPQQGEEARSIQQNQPAFSAETFQRQCMHMEFQALQAAQNKYYRSRSRTWYDQPCRSFQYFIEKKVMLCSALSDVHVVADSP